MLISYLTPLKASCLYWTQDSAKCAFPLYALKSALFWQILLLTHHCQGHVIRLAFPGMEVDFY